MGSLRFAPTSAGGDRLVGNNDRGVVLQLIEAAVGNDVARNEAVNLGCTAVCHARFNAAHVREIALNHVHKRCLTILLNGGGRNQRHSLQCIHEQAGVYKLIGEECVVLVVEERAAFDSASRGVNLV